MGMKKPPRTEGGCSRTRANVESCLSQLTTVRSSQTAPWQETELVLFVGEGQTQEDSVARVSEPLPPPAAM